jgi:general secretion pathway protein B
MSFILDALKKSEAERLRKDAPGFAAVPDSPREKSTSHWIWIVAALIGINITVLVVIFMKPDAVREPVAVNPAAVSASVVPATAIAAEPRRAEPTAAKMAADPVTPAINIPAPQSAEPAVAVASYESPQVTESYATFNDLKAQGVLQLPDMHLDIHVYSSEPEDRFVFVNMSKYKERATLDEGPVVREITPDGVILEYLGTGFLLPRE